MFPISPIITKCSSNKLLQYSCSLEKKPQITRKKLFNVCNTCTPFFSRRITYDGIFIKHHSSFDALRVQLLVLLFFCCCHFISFEQFFYALSSFIHSATFLWRSRLWIWFNLGIFYCKIIQQAVCESLETLNRAFPKIDDL